MASVRKELRRTAEEREEERKREREDREKFKEESDKERERLNEENAKEREKLESENVSVRIRLDSVQRRNEELELQLKKTAANEENGVNKENERCKCCNSAIQCLGVVLAHLEMFPKPPLFHLKCLIFLLYFYIHYIRTICTYLF